MELFRYIYWLGERGEQLIAHIAHQNQPLKRGYYGY